MITYNGGQLFYGPPMIKVIACLKYIKNISYDGRELSYLSRYSKSPMVIGASGILNSYIA